MITRDELEILHRFGSDDVQALVIEVRRLRDALLWYADDGTHAPPGHSSEGWCRDSGRRARVALGLRAVEDVAFPPVPDVHVAVSPEAIDKALSPGEKVKR